MRIFLIFVALCVFAPSSFSKNQRDVSRFYGGYLKGIYLIEKGEYLAGIKELEKVKNKDPQSVHLRLKIASALIRLEKTEEAEKVLQEAKEIAPDNLDISLALIFVYSYSRQDDKLEKEYENFLEKAHEAKPKDISVSEYLAQFYFYKKKPDEAIKVYEKILEANPDYVDAFFWLGYLYDGSGQRQKAIEAWEKGLSVDPAYPPILNSLGYIYAVEGIKLNKAEEMIKKALEKEPENGAYLDSLGWVYFKKGDLKRAQEYLIKAISYAKDPDIYEHLGDLYVEMGDVEKALKYYKEGFVNFPEDESLKLKLEEYEGKNKVLKK